MCCICVIYMCYLCVCVCVGQAAGQMYSYPARCWRKKRRLLAPLDPQLRLCELRLGKKSTTRLPKTVLLLRVRVALHVVFMLNAASDKLASVSICYLTICFWLASRSLSPGLQVHSFP